MCVYLAATTTEGHKMLSSYVTARLALAVRLNASHQPDFSTNRSNPGLINTFLSQICTEVWKDVRINLLDEANSAVKTDI